MTDRRLLHKKHVDYFLLGRVCLHVRTHSHTHTHARDVKTNNIIVVNTHANRISRNSVRRGRTGQRRIRPNSSGTSHTHVSISLIIHEGRPENNDVTNKTYGLPAPFELVRLTRI